MLPQNSKVFAKCSKSMYTSFRCKNNGLLKSCAFLQWKAQQDVSTSVFYEFNLTCRRTILIMKHFDFKICMLSLHFHSKEKVAVTLVQIKHTNMHQLSLKWI